MRKRLRRSWAELKALGGSAVPPIVTASVSYLLTWALLSDLDRAVLAAIAGVAVAVVRDLGGRPARDRSAAVVGAAAVDVLDRHLLVGELTFFLENGAPVTLRAYADAAQSGRLGDELQTGAQARFLGDRLQEILHFFENATARSLMDLPAWRTVAGDLADGLGDSASSASELADAIESSFLAKDGETADTASETRMRAIGGSLSEALIRAARAAETLERRWDPEAAAQRTADRLRRSEKRATERREARIALVAVAIDLHERAAPLRAIAARDLPVDGWIVRHAKVRSLYDDLTAVTNAQSIHMDEPTLNAARGLQRSLNQVNNATVALEQVEIARKAGPLPVEFDVLLENGSAFFREGLAEFAHEVAALGAD